MQQLQEDAERAKAVFRHERLEETLESYSRLFDTFVPVFRSIIDKLPMLAAGKLDPDTLADMLRDKNHRTAFRYLTAPPISDDDLKTLADARLSALALRTDPDQARRVRDVVSRIIDPHRFPWIGEARSPADCELQCAILASASMAAAKQVETSRRNEAKKSQEARVKDVLQALGFKAVPSRDILLLDRAPNPGEFCGESKLGDTRADLVIRLPDRRVMAIECKVSNSAVNSFKRVNHEAVGKAVKWLRAFGDRATVPSAVLSGVFNPSNLEAAQRAGLSLFWVFRLDDLADFIKATKTEAS